ncbi:conserved protein of unknown function [Streptomyces sp. KY75]|nr:conserved protein of unknown function [Streptomyces sp. KY70]CAD5987837.1 conserved protein of unknown function [Streptomyces sp. KY75]
MDRRTDNADLDPSEAVPGGATWGTIDGNIHGTGTSPGAGALA